MTLVGMTNVRKGPANSVFIVADAWTTAARSCVVRYVRLFQVCDTCAPDRIEAAARRPTTGAPSSRRLRSLSDV
jgi:hypothetical protein